MHKRYRHLVGLVALTLASSVAAFPVTKLEKYTARLNVLTPQRADVSITAALKDSGLKDATKAAVTGMLCRILRYPQQQVGNIQVTDKDGNAVPATLLTFESTWEVRVVAAQIPAQYTLHYSVESAEEIRRFPLAVLDATAPEIGSPVEIQASLPHDDSAVGSTFPAFQWSDAQHGSTRLNAIPSVVLLKVKRTADITLLDRLLDTSTLTTALMFGFLLVSSIVWYVRSR